MKCHSLLGEKCQRKPKCEHACDLRVSAGPGFAAQFVTTNPATPDQGDERRASHIEELAAKYSSLDDYGQTVFPEGRWEMFVADLATEHPEAIGTTSLDEAYERCGWAKPKTAPQPVAQEASGLRQALELSREYVENAMHRMYDGTNGQGIREEAKRRLAIIDAALASQGASHEGEVNGVGWYTSIAPHQPEAPTVEQAITQLKLALRDSKGWMLDYSDAIIRDAIDRKVVSAEAGKGEPFGYWHEGPTEDESEFFLAKDLPDNECLRCFPLYRDPSEAVSGEVSEKTRAEMLQILDRLYCAGWNREGNHREAALRAVLALAGSGGKA